jgi:cytochrome b561
MGGNVGRTPAEAERQGLAGSGRAAFGRKVVNAFVRGYELFGLAHLPQIGDPELRRPITHWHGLGANLLLILALSHAAAALLHYYVVKDRTLQRMLPRLR